MLKGNLKKYYYIYFLQSMYLYTPIFTLFLVEGGITIPTFLYAQAIYSTVVFLAEVPTGIIADRYGKKLSILIAFILEAIFMLGLLGKPSGVTFMFLYGMSALSGAFLSGAEEAFLYESAKKEKVDYLKYKSKLSIVGSIGLIFAFSTGGLAYALFGNSSFPYLVLLSSVCFIFASLIIWRLQESVLVKTETKRELNVWQDIKTTLNVLHSNKTVRAIIIFLICTLPGTYILQDTYQVHFEQMKVNPLLLGQLLTLGYLFKMLIQYLLPTLVNKFSKTGMMALFSFLLGVSFISLAITHNPYLLVAIFITMQGLMEATNPLISKIVNDKIQSDLRATILSGISFAKRFVQIFTTLILGYVLQLYDIPTTYLVQGLYLVIGTGVGYYLVRRILK